MNNDSQVVGYNKKKSLEEINFNRQTRRILEEKQTDNRYWFTKALDKVAGVKYSGYK